MRFPSKRVAAIAAAEVRRKEAFHANDPEAFAAAAAEIKTHETAPDIYTCICCAEDFPDGPHVELLIAAALIFGGPEVERYDYGINDVARGDAPGRRIKLCGDCADEFKIHVRDYLEMR